MIRISDAPMLTPTEIRWPSIGVETTVRTLDRGLFVGGKKVRNWPLREHQNYIIQSTFLREKEATKRLKGSLILYEL
jgi:hypothetical protein